jgi:hypothetical protein
MWVRVKQTSAIQKLFHLRCCKQDSLHVGHWQYC